MRRRPPRTTRTYTLFPYTTLFRSEGLKVIPVRDKSGVAYKGYKGDANARFDVWQLPDGKWTAAVVSMFDAHRHDFIPERPHPAAKKIMSLRQNDLIAIEKDGVFREIVRVVKFGANGQITIAAHQEIGRAHVCTTVTNAHLVCRLLLARQYRDMIARDHTHVP